MKKYYFQPENPDKFTVESVYSVLVWTYKYFGKTVYTQQLDDLIEQNYYTN